MIVPNGRQIRAARDVLRWTQQELARKAQVSVVAVRRIEASVALPRTPELLRIIAVFKEAGLKFVNGRVVLTNRKAAAWLISSGLASPWIP